MQGAKNPSTIAMQPSTRPAATSSPMVEALCLAIAVLAFWLSCLGPPHLAVWPLRAFALALGLSTIGALL